MWEFYTSSVDSLRPIDILICPGDAIDGKGERSGGVELITPDRLEQVRMAAEAVAYAKALGATVLADDSGLEVDALGGAPGVHSARYAGVGAGRAERDAANNARLLRELAGVPHARRTARFVCVLCVARPDGSILAEARGHFEGWIGEAPRGSNGFGYDPLLVLADGRTSAELSPAEKNARSHRGNALRALVPLLRP